MTWQQLLPLGVVLAVAVVLIWRSADPKKRQHHGCGCGCGCAHEPEPETKKPARHS